jgi:hypothetical protein
LPASSFGAAAPQALPASSFGAAAPQALAASSFGAAAPQALAASSFGTGPDLAALGRSSTQEEVPEATPQRVDSYIGGFVTPDEAGTAAGEAQEQQEEAAGGQAGAYEELDL